MQSKQITSQFYIKPKNETKRSNDGIFVNTCNLFCCTVCGPT